MQQHSSSCKVKRRSRSSPASGGRTGCNIERLEARQLLSASVTATALNPPLTAGTTWTYQLSGGVTATQTQTVIGPATFNGNSATEVDAVNQFRSSSTTVQNFLAFTSQGLIEYGTVTTSSAGSTTQVITPALIEFPATLTVGSPVTNTYSYSSGGQETVTLMLVSGTPQSITVPAGTYSAYEVDNDTTGTGSVTIQSWFAAGVGLVKQVITTGPTSVTQELTAFSGSPGGVGGGSGSGAVSSILKAAVPSSVVATTALATHDTATLTAASAVRGAVSASLVLSPDTDAADSVFTLATGHTALNLASGKSRVLPLIFARSIPASVAAGTYNVLLVTTDPTGATQTTTVQQMTVVAPVVDLTGAFVHVPATARAGRNAPYVFTITNSAAANVAAVGNVQITFESSPDGLPGDATPIETVTRRVNLKPGKSVRLGIALPLASTAFVVADVDPGNAVFPNDLDPSNNFFATSLAVTVA